MHLRLKLLSLIATTLMLSLSSVFQMPLANLKISGALASEAGIWKEFSPKEGGFSVLLPGTPVARKEAAIAEKNLGPSQVYVLVLEDESGVYGINYEDFPNLPPQLTPAQINTLLNAWRDDFVKNSKLKSDRPIALNGYLGKEVEIENGEGVIKARIYWVNERLYRVFVVADSEEVFADGGDKFLNSFKLIAGNARQLSVSPGTTNNKKPK